MASYGRNSVFIEAAQETPQVTENSTLELVTCGTTARWHSSRRPDIVGRDEMFSLSETELLELCFHSHQYKIKTITKIKPLTTTSRLTTLLNNNILYIIIHPSLSSILLLYAEVVRLATLHNSTLLPAELLQW